jgi:hypothetical protein
LLLPLVLRWRSQSHCRQRSQIRESEARDIDQFWKAVLLGLIHSATRERDTLLFIWA